MIIYLDFDGTVVEHAYPKMGRFVPHSLQVIERLKNAGHEIVLNTYRADCGDGSLDEAVSYLKYNQFVWRKQVAEIVPDRVLATKIRPEPWNPNNAKDCIYIDDIALNMPLVPSVMTRGDMVDWVTVERQLESAGVLPTFKPSVPLES